MPKYRHAKYIRKSYLLGEQMKIIGAGLGRTGTFSLKMAIDSLGFGPTHHMEEVFRDLPKHVPLWAAAAAGVPDWPTIYAGFHSATDWPTAGFVPELVAAYPQAKFILTLRGSEIWTDSYLETISLVLSGESEMPPEFGDWLMMARQVLARGGFLPGLSRDALIAGFEAHSVAVRARVLTGQLLEFNVGEGWGPLCRFLGVPVPEEPFPRTNDRIAFWDEKHRPDGVPR